MNMEIFCVQYRVGYRSSVAFFCALSAQDAVDQFRSNHFQSIVAVYCLEKVDGWE